MRDQGSFQVSEAVNQHVCGRDFPRGQINGVPVCALGPEDALRAVESFLDCPNVHVLNHLAAHPFVLAGDDPALRKALSRADLNVPDGMGVVWALRLQGYSHLRERVYGPDFLLDVVRWGVERNLKHAFLGGSPMALDALIASLKAAVPLIAISGSYAPRFREVTTETVVDDIDRLPSDADILWVGIGTPKQQRWAEIARAYWPAKLIITVGAAFDFIAGVKRKAPRQIQRMGLEWAFRLATEPRRLWRRYLVGNPKFVVAAVRQRMGR